MTSAPDVSVCLFAHEQGLSLHASLTSAERSIARAERDGVTFEPLCVLHDPSELTSQYAQERLGARWRILRLDSKLLGTVRNAATVACRGLHIAFLDAGDLWSENWISASVAAARTGIRPSVWRHEVVLQGGEDLSSGAGYSCRFQPDADGNRDFTDLLGANPFASSFLAPREILAAVPFPIEDPARGWHNIDWWWSCNAAAEGYEHRIVPETFLYRQFLPGGADEPKRIGPTLLSRRTSGRHEDRRSVVWD